MPPRLRRTRGTCSLRNRGSRRRARAARPRRPRPRRRSGNRARRASPVRCGEDRRRADLPREPARAGRGRIARAAVEDRLPVEADAVHLRGLDVRLGEQLEHGRGVDLAERGVDGRELGRGRRRAARDREHAPRERGIERVERCKRSFHLSRGGAPATCTSAASTPSTEVPVMSPTTQRLRAGTFSGSGAGLRRFMGWVRRRRPRPRARSPLPRPGAPRPPRGRPARASSRSPS